MNEVSNPKNLEIQVTFCDLSCFSLVISGFGIRAEVQESFDDVIIGIEVSISVPGMGPPATSVD